MSARNLFLERLADAMMQASKDDLKRLNRILDDCDLRRHPNGQLYLWVLCHLSGKGEGSTSVTEVYRALTGLPIHDETAPISWHETRMALTFLRDKRLVDIEFSKGPDQGGGFRFDSGPLFWKWGFKALEEVRHE